MKGTLWALLPAIIAILMAIFTKQVYVSLFIGLLFGAICLTNGNIVTGFEKLVECIASNIFGDFEHAYIILFAICLGILVVLITISGGSLAYGEWATKKIKTKRGALLSTFGLGLIIFIDDYFNCLTVGNVMRPVTDKNKVSREKLAYFIDCTAAPVCIIAPISSWAAAVGTTLNIENGFEVFLKSIPFNLYAILTILLIMIVALKDFNFGLMKKMEEKAQNSIIEENDEEEKIGGLKPNPKGKVIDLLLPIVFLILSSTIFMMYTGGFFEHWNILTAFADCEASKSLSIGSLLTLVVFYIYYIARKLLTFEQIGDSIVGGFRTMAPSITILVLAWSLSSMCSSTEYLSLSTCSAFDSLKSIGFLFPAIIYVISALIAFSTGTSWGTFALLLPLTIQFIGNTTDPLFFISVAAVLGGAVSGSNLSPISDTTILSSTGAKCQHINHVKTQMPYTFLVSGCAFATYIILGLISVLVKDANYILLAILCMVIGIVLLISSVFVISKITKSNEANKDN
ncbi:MAG: Na+/H+ antiporter NhaC family protein [Clostridia bacterium]|nr:Na+/H+ antiporter NhaC family protein [Clostridia bacterium]